MAALSDYLESGLLHHVFRGETFAKLSNISIALTSGIPTDDQTGTNILEVSSGDGTTLSGYSRISLGAPASDGDAKWSYTAADNTAGSGVIKNAVDITFGQATLDWGRISGVVVLDSATHSTHPSDDPGNVLMHSQLDNPRSIYIGDSVKFSTNTLQISFD
tara:strand:+ start:4044 stop:4526 length:483 start_codon:yes stop_codon:yes gene_type:complete